MPLALLRQQQREYPTDPDALLVTRLLGLPLFLQPEGRRGIFFFLILRWFTIGIRAVRSGALARKMIEWSTMVVGQRRTKSAALLGVKDLKLIRVKERG